MKIESAQTILVIGQGGREHAIAWKLANELAPGSRVIVAPGNSGTCAEAIDVSRALGAASIENCHVAANDLQGLLELAKTHAVDFTVVGPEVPLALGIVDLFQAHGLAIFGPSAKAAVLEASKSFTKDFLARHQIPTARYQVFTDAQLALDYLAKQGLPIVIKADGLAAGKGVVVALNAQQAQAAVIDMLAIGHASHATSTPNDAARIVIEEFLPGVEASYIVIASGTDFVALASSQDHKRVGNGDTGPNTGGMGAYSPAPVVTPAIEAQIQRDIIAPTLAGMNAEGREFCGFLYAGVMIDASGMARVLEFNARLGDPETQPILSRMRSPLLPLLQAAAAKQLASQSAPIWDPRTALGVVICAAGYPGAVEKGARISDAADLNNPSADTLVFHAGSKATEGHVLTDGGRVLCVVGLGHSVQTAQTIAYNRADQFKWTGSFMRRDIGWRAV
jgi:phosphoribosylamine---glycine ligase